jgi:hypothetical protein
MYAKVDEQVDRYYPRFATSILSSPSFVTTTATTYKNSHRMNNIVTTPPSECFTTFKIKKLKNSTVQNENIQVIILWSLPSVTIRTWAAHRPP